MKSCAKLSELKRERSSRNVRVDVVRRGRAKIAQNANADHDVIRVDRAPRGAIAKSKAEMRLANSANRNKNRCRIRSRRSKQSHAARAGADAVDAVGAVVEAGVIKTSGNNRPIVVVSAASG